ncbi:MAG: OsmC family protein [Bacteroidota bacterium]
MTQIIAKIDKSRYKTILSTERHDIVGDEPLPYGTDLGPNPYDFLLMSLGSCTAITLRMYADKRGWDLQDVEVQLSQERVYHENCENCESQSGYVHIITKKIKVNGNLDNAQKSKLLEISEKCPVNKTLLNEIKINTVTIS